MSSQVLRAQSSATTAFTSLLRAYAATTRRLNAQLVADHGLTINDYEVLLRLFSSPERRMRRVDLAGQVLLTPSGVTRLLGYKRPTLVLRNRVEATVSALAGRGVLGAEEGQEASAEVSSDPRPASPKQGEEEACP